MRLTLLGTGSSGGVPRVGGDWGDCDPAEPRNRRRRCSALVDVYDPAAPEDMTRVLIDTSPDLREQLLDARVEHLDALIYTHDHADQSHGIDDVRALALRQRRQIPTFMDAATRTTLAEKFSYCFAGKGDYPPILDLQPLVEVGTPVTMTGAGGAVSFLPLDQEHGRIRSLAFRIGPVAYCNDVSDLPEETLAQLEGLEVLIIDALRYRPHPTHAHVDKALAWIERLAPKRAALTNLHVDLDYQTLKAALPDRVEPAYDGWSVSCTYLHV
ncbi:MAG: MBL fold metallo-hydrolase [Pseudomonadota bacterium]